jgi:hypothetical protein
MMSREEYSRQPRYKKVIPGGNSRNYIWWKEGENVNGGWPCMVTPDNNERLSGHEIYPHAQDHWTIPLLH